MACVYSNNGKRYFILNSVNIDLKDCYSLNSVLHYNGKPLLDESGNEMRVTDDIQYTMYQWPLNTEEKEA